MATKKYVDDHSGGVSGDYLPLAGGTMTGAVNMGGNKITSVATPTSGTDAANKSYVDSKAPATTATIDKGYYSTVCYSTTSFYSKFFLPFVFTSKSSATTSASNFTIVLTHASASGISRQTLKVSSISIRMAAGSCVMGIAFTTSSPIAASNITDISVYVNNDFTVKND